MRGPISVLLRVNPAIFNPWCRLDLRASRPGHARPISRLRLPARRIGPGIFASDKSRRGSGESPRRKVGSRRQGRTRTASCPAASRQHCISGPTVPRPRGTARAFRVRCFKSGERVNSLPGSFGPGFTEIDGIRAELEVVQEALAQIPRLGRGAMKLGKFAQRQKFSSSL